jgi:hypothetical protein
MSEFTVEIDSSVGVYLTDEQMIVIDQTMRAAPCVVGPSISANLQDGSFGVTMTVVAPSQDEAVKRAREALDAALIALGHKPFDPDRIASQRERTPALA